MTAVHDQFIETQSHFLCSFGARTLAMSVRSAVEAQLR